MQNGERSAANGIDGTVRNPTLLALMNMGIMVISAGSYVAAFPSLLLDIGILVVG